MGLIGDWVKSKNMKDPVRGTLQVTASTYPPDDATSANYSLNGIVSADGIPPTAVEHAGMAKTKKWPQAGQTLPVTVDRADPTRLHIEWDEVQDSWATARQDAEALAARMRAGGTPAVPTSFTVTGQPTVTTSSQVIDASGIPGVRDEIMKLAMSGGTPDQILGVLKEHGIDVNHSVAGLVAAAQGSVPAVSTEDTATRLHKLQDLKRDGLITEEEYEAQRAKILEEI